MKSQINSLEKKKIDIEKHNGAFEWWIGLLAGKLGLKDIPGLNARAFQELENNISPDDIELIREYTQIDFPHSQNSMIRRQQSLQLAAIPDVSQSNTQMGQS